MPRLDRIDHLGRPNNPDQAPTRDGDRDVVELLNSVRHRLRRVLILDRVERILPGAVVVGAALVALSRIVVAPWLVPVALVAIVVALIVAVTQGWRVGLSDRTVAEVTDHQVGSRDALATALEFADLGGPFGDQIRTRARTVARTTQPDHITPMSPSRRRWATVALAGVALAAMLLFTSARVHVPTPDELAVESFKADATQLRDQADKLLAQEPSPDAVTLAQQLNALADQLDETKTLAEGLQKLDQTRSELDASISDSFASERAAVQGLEQSVQNSPLSPAGGDAAAQLQSLAEQLESMTEQQRADLAERLDAAASSQAAGSPEVAASLSDAASALSNGDISGASDALAAASSAQSNASQSVADQSARSTASDSLGTAAADAQQAANGNGQGSKGQGKDEGDGDGDGDGEGQGQGQGKGKGQGAGANGAGGQGNPSGNVTGGGSGTKGEGGVGRPNGTGKGTRSGTDDAPTVWLPGGESEKLDATAANQGGESEVVGKGQVASSSGGANVPISDVIANYQQQATEALERDQIPPSSRDLVQRYFDELAGNGQ